MDSLGGVPSAKRSTVTGKNAAAETNDPDVFADDTGEEEVGPSTVVEQRPSEEADDDVLVKPGDLHAKLAGDRVRQRGRAHQRPKTLRQMAK
ncbi:hypothetical protein FNAPI_7661 [Fusarium napiforme]|uniref:Uncharacterized protein n=1 Tax=Fusarium napiforme TaxID=42672 RepID=A0A8H5J9K7_9HYPO|nr:hypothetical protein FNAPI_7661 [Fusarium napiforme]